MLKFECVSYCRVDVPLIVGMAVLLGIASV